MSDVWQGYASDAQQANSGDIWSGVASPVDSKPQSSLGSQLGRQIGLTGRYGIEAAMAFPNMVGDAANSLINMALPDKYKLGMPSQVTSDTLSNIGFPQPQGDLENIVGAASRGGISAGIGAALAGANGFTQLAARPIMQMISGATGGGSAEAARQSGAGPVGQFSAGMIGGMTPYAVSAPLQAVGRGIKGTIQPLYQGGQQAIAGNALNKLAANPPEAISNLNNASEFVPGSLPTTAEASGDYGLMAAQKGIRNENPLPFSNRSSDQNTARNILLNTVTQHDGAVQSAQAARDAETGAMREGAFNTAKEFTSQSNLKPVTDAIDQINNSPVGKREMVQKAMMWAQQRLAQAGTDPASLYEVRKDINDAMQGKFSGEASNLALAKGQLKTVKDALDQTIESGAQGYKDYLSRYRELSIPINQMQTAQDIKSRVMQAAPDVNGFDFLSQPKWSSVVQANRAELTKQLSPQQMQVMDSITSDLDRGATLNSVAMKPPGSDTFQNLSLSNMLGSMLGKFGDSTIGKTIGRPLAWLYKIPDDKINQLMVDAMLDPRMARQMMQKANTSTVQSFGEALKQRALASGMGSFLGTTANIRDKQ